ncbi:MAG: ATP synthase subunit I [Clostridia bacterium]|nr:ATP synthase subunit I [Clostridia bacterium]MBQ4618633.1 ATP synthase subunit I [Clostridia bacterium]
MDGVKFVRRETAQIAIGEMLLVGAMIAVFAILGKFDWTVLVGGLTGGILTILNFYIMALNAVSASDKAVKNDVTGGKALMHFSYIARYAVIFVILCVLAVTKAGHPVACALPLVFIQPVIYLREFFRKKVG